MTGRAQSNLAALAAALLLVCGALVATLAVAGGAFAAADRSPAATQTADAVADGFLAAFGVPGRANAVSAPELANVSAATLSARVPAARGESVGLTVGGSAIIRSDADGARAERLVAVLTPETTANRTTNGGGVFLPPGTEAAAVRLRGGTGENASRVTELRADGRTVLANESGLRGAYRVPLPAEGGHEIDVETEGGDANTTVRGISYEERGAVLTVITDA